MFDITVVTVIMYIFLLIITKEPNTMVGINSILILDLFPLEIEVSGKNSLVFSWA